MEVDGTRRTFVVDVPEPYDPNRVHPVVYGFHGNWDSGAGAQKGYQVAKFFPEAIAIYPDGLRSKEDGPTTWAFEFPSRDSAFFDQLHATVRDGLCVDESRVFAIGYSAGGFMANAVACTRRVAGVASISGGTMEESCEASVPAWLEHGEADEVVPLRMGEEARALWIRTNAVEPRPEPYRHEGCVYFGGSAAPVLWCTHPEGHVLRPDGFRNALEFLRGLKTGG